MKDSGLKIILENTKFLVLCILLALNMSCDSNETSPELETHFTKKQIIDLNKINDFFISEYLKSDKNNYKGAFLKFTDSLKINCRFSSNDKVLFKKQLNIYNSISPSTFDEIWKIKTVEKGKFKGETYITPNYKGDFKSFLNEIKLQNSFTEQSFEQFEKSGNINTIFFDGYFYYHQNTFEYNDFHNQIIIAIFYMNSLDDFERDPKRKKRNEDFFKEVNPEWINDY